MKKRLVWLGALCLFATTAAARDLEDILKEKKIIDPIEANEAKAAKERAQAATDKAGTQPAPAWSLGHWPCNAFFRNGRARKPCC